MKQEEAFNCLIEAGLHVRALDDGSFIGGSHVDHSSIMNIVMNGFALQSNLDGTYTYHRGDPAKGKKMLLEEAVSYIIKTVKPEKDIPAPPIKIPSGPQFY